MTFPYGDPVDPRSVDMDPQKLSKIVALFRKQQALGSFPGGQMVARRFDKIVLNENVGIARGYRAGEFSPDPYPIHQRTPFPVYSTGKPIAAIAIALLEDRGQIDITAPIATFLPEFASQGKEQITTLDVLTHTAGILIPSSYTLAPEKKLVWRTIVETAPMYPRGTFAYMPLEYGVILSEIIQKITGKTFPEFVVEAISKPLHLPALQYGLADRPMHTLAHSYWFGENPAKIYGSNIANNFEESMNDQACFDSMNPAYNMISDAASLAAFYEFLLNKGKSSAGNQLISAQTILNYTNKAVSGWWQTKTCFGHGGVYSSLAFGDHQTKLAIAIITNGNLSMYDFYKRFLPLSHGIRKACI